MPVTETEKMLIKGNKTIPLRHMKVGFTGAGGTGKSAVMTRVNSEELQLKVLPSVARGVFTEMGVSSEVEEKMLTPEGVWKLQKEIFVRKMEQGSSERGFISDRTLLDTYVYIMVKCRESNIPDSVVEAMGELTRVAMSKLDLVCYFPLDQFWSPGDGMRDESRLVASLVDAAILGCLVRWGIPYLRVKGGSVSDRVLDVTSVILYLQGKKNYTILS